MIDDANAVKRQRSCYDTSTFKNVKTEKAKECVSDLDQSRITPIDIIPYGNHGGERVTSTHDLHRQPLALCTDIKVVERKKGLKGKHDSSIKEITVRVLLGLENGAVLQYSFDMSLMVGLSNLFWTITSGPFMSHTFTYAERIVAVHYKTSKMFHLHHLALDLEQLSFLLSKVGYDQTSLRPIRTLPKGFEY